MKWDQSNVALLVRVWNKWNHYMIHKVKHWVKKSCTMHLCFWKAFLGFWLHRVVGMKVVMQPFLSAPLIGVLQTQWQRKDPGDTRQLGPLLIWVCLSWEEINLLSVKNSDLYHTGSNDLYLLTFFCHQSHCKGSCADILCFCFNVTILKMKSISRSNVNIASDRLIDSNVSYWPLSWWNH